MAENKGQIGYGYKEYLYGALGGQQKVVKLSPLDQLRQAASKGSTEKSVRWFRDKINQLGKSNFGPRKILNSDIGTVEPRLKIGSMYLYQYQAKTAEKLPYWDMFPLVLPFRATPTGFYGINMHYLPISWRVELFGRLLEYTTSPRNTEDMKFKLSWKLLGNFSQFPESKFCTKQYLTDHVRSNLIRIHPDDWKIAIHLPLESFQKASSQKVHSDARRFAR